MGPKNTPILSLVCPNCGESFPSMMQMDRPTFAKIRLESVLEHCSACEKAARFRKGDYFFVPDEDPTPTSGAGRDSNPRHEG